MFSFIEAILFKEDPAAEESRKESAKKAKQFQYNEFINKNKNDFSRLVEACPRWSKFEYLGVEMMVVDHIGFDGTMEPEIVCEFWNGTCFREKYFTIDHYDLLKSSIKKVLSYGS